MNYKKLIEWIKYISERHSLVNSCIYSNNIYEVNHIDAIYPLVQITPQPSQMDNPVSTYSFIFYYVDRLLNDKSNELDIQSAGYKALNDILLDIDGLIDTETQRPYSNVTVFSEKFSDECAGVFVEVKIDSYNQNNECTSLSNDSVLVYSELNGPLITENNLDIILD